VIFERTDTMQKWFNNHGCWLCPHCIELYQSSQKDYELDHCYFAKDIRKELETGEKAMTFAQMNVGAGI